MLNLVEGSNFITFIRWIRNPMGKVQDIHRGCREDSFSAIILHGLIKRFLISLSPCLSGDHCLIHFLSIEDTDRLILLAVPPPNNHIISQRAIYSTKRFGNPLSHFYWHRPSQIGPSPAIESCFLRN